MLSQPNRVLEDPQVLNLTQVRPQITPPPLSIDEITTPTTQEAVEAILHIASDITSPTAKTPNYEAWARSASKSYINAATSGRS